ncbi:MAG: Hsp20/alpha crystallin family protein [Pseudomonadota bacterium]
MTERKRGRVTGREALEEIDLRLGGLLGALSETLGQVVEAAEARGQEGGRGVKVDTGVRVRMGGLDVDRDPEPTPKPEPPAARKPDIEVYDEPTSWTVTAELPGISPDDLDVTRVDGALRIRTSGARRFEASVPVPDALSGAVLDIRLKNGILEIRAEKSEAER